MQLVALRLHDLGILFQARYGQTLPDDDAGRDDLALALNHLACLPHPKRAIDAWIDQWAPWLTAGEQRDIVGPIMANPMRWKADALAWKLGLKARQRSELGITTIGAIDEGKAARTRRRRQQAKDRKRAARKAAGAVSRRDYEARSLERAKPWIAEGISRATWFRRRARETARETSPSAP